MQIVIDIPEEVYKAYKLNSNLSFLNSDQQSFAKGHLINGLVNGTPLPKGHGDLVDVGQCNRRLFYKQCGGADALITVKIAFDMLMALPKIIHIDKE